LVVRSTSQLAFLSPLDVRYPEHIIKMSIPYVVKTDGKAKLTPKNKNIDNSEDAFYRYKVRQLYIQIVGKGKMIKTVLLNVDDVSKDLQVAPQYLTAYLGYELGAQSKYDLKKPDRERATLNGDIDSGAFNKALLQFIKEFVLCPICGLPEITMEIDKKTDKLTVTCRGCGRTSPLDLKPKFKQYIINHPFTITTGTTNVESEAKKKAEDAGASGSSAEGGEKKEKTRKPRSKKKSDSDDDDVEWGTDLSEEAVLARRRELLALSDRAAQLVMGDLPQAQDPADELRDQLANDPSTDAVAFAKQLQAKHKFDQSKLVECVLRGVMNPSDPAETAKKHSATLAKVVGCEADQLVLLEELERVFADKDPAFLKKAPVAIKMFYDTDLTEEDTILKWHAGLKNMAIKEAVQPLITWLKEAEEGSDDDE